MRTVSAAFKSAVMTSHTLAARAVVAGTIVPVLDGSVTLDATAAVRARCDVTVAADPALVPDSATSLLAPYGNEIQLSRGVRFPDGSTELVSLGVFGLQEVEVADTAGTLAIRVAGLDRAARVANARFEEPYQVAAGTNYVTAIRDVLLAGYPSMPYSFPTTAQTTPTLIAEEGGDRWAFAQEMATAIAMRLYFNGDGVCVLTPDVVSDPVATLAEGEVKVSALLSAGRRWTREGAYNRVIATGENTGEAAPVRGVATDLNPQSPTYYYGPFGRVPRFYSSPFITTTAQATTAAETLLRSQLGTTEQVNFGSLVLPHLEPGDTVRITRTRAGIDENHILDSLALPMTATGTMTGQTRAVVA